MDEPSGWHSRGFLPHFDSPDVPQFITFRLADSLPAGAGEALRDAAHATVVLDDALDRGLGACWLGRPEMAAIVEDALLAFDGEHYRLIAWCVMPNHVHVLIEAIAGRRTGSVVGSWKRYTARQANSLLGRRGAFWQEDYWDRFVRDKNHLMATIDYIERNPVAAGLATATEDWRWSSARQRRPPTQAMGATGVARSRENKT